MEVDVRNSESDISTKGLDIGRGDEHNGPLCNVQYWTDFEDVRKKKFTNL